MPSLFEVTAGKLTGPTTGGTVTHASNKSTTVVLNAESGQITMNGAALGAGLATGSIKPGMFDLACLNCCATAA